MAEIRSESIPLLLGSIDNALRTGGSMTTANLAFALLCDELGVDRRRLVFDVLAVNKLAALKIAEEVADG